MTGGIRRTDPEGAAATGSRPRHAVSAAADRGSGKRPDGPRPRTPESDIDLVMRIRRGERDAFDTVYQHYADDVFSMCLLILGDAKVAQAAAGTAFALVARTRLTTLGDATRLRSWLLELARGSALAWSGSPQARSGPVRHAVAPEEMLAKVRITPAPAQLWEGLVRTFDRAATAAEGTASPSRVQGSVPTQASVPDAPAGAASGTPGDLDDAPTAVVLPATRPGGSSPDLNDRRVRPTVTVAASLLLAVVGITAAINWPTAAEVGASYPDVAFGPSTPGPRPPATDRNQTAVIIPTVAGEFARQLSGQRTEPAVPGVGGAKEMVQVAQRSTAEATRPQAVPEQGPPNMINSLPRATTTPAAVAPTTPAERSAANAPPTDAEPQSAPPATSTTSAMPSATPDTGASATSVPASGATAAGVGQRPQPDSVVGIQPV